MTTLETVVQKFNAWQAHALPEQVTGLLYVLAAGDVSASSRVVWLVVLSIDSAMWGKACGDAFDEFIDEFNALAQRALPQPAAISETVRVDALLGREDSSMIDLFLDAVFNDGLPEPTAAELDSAERWLDEKKVGLFGDAIEEDRQQQIERWLTDALGNEENEIDE